MKKIKVTATHLTSFVSFNITQGDKLLISDTFKGKADLPFCKVYFVECADEPIKVKIIDAQNKEMRLIAEVIG